MVISRCVFDIICSINGPCQRRLTCSTVLYRILDLNCVSRFGLRESGLLQHRMIGSDSVDMMCT